jgi:transcriptional regulator with XRE-family HTH domain
LREGLGDGEKRRKNKMMIYVFQPEKVKARREELNMNLRDLGEKSGVDYSAISKIEKGTREPGANTLGALAGALGVTPNFFYEKEKR